MKKIISLVLVLVLVLGTFSFAFAAEVVAPSDVTDEDQIDAVEVLMGLGIVDGYTDGTYKPAKVVTRAEMAKLLIVELGYEDLTGGSAPFSDTAGHWGEGYIALAAGLGLVNGYPDGTFQPDNTVSFDEAITMVLRGLGYNDASLTGSWPTNYKIKAINIDLLDDVDVSGAGADRGNIAVMLYNALFLAYGEVDADDLWVENTDDDGDAKNVIDKIGKYIEGDEENGVLITYDDVYDEDDALDTVIDLEPYLYQIVKYYENADEEVAYIDEVLTDSIVLDNVEADGTEYTADDADDDEYTISTTGAYIVYNHALGSDGAELLANADLTVIYADDEDLDGNDNGDFDDADDSDSDKIIAIIATEVTDVELAGDDYEEDDTTIEGIDLPVDDDDDFDESRLVVMGDVDSVEDIEENDVIEVFESADYVYNDEDGDDLYLVVTRDVVEGEVEEFDEEDSVVIDGVEVDYSDMFDDDYITGNELGDEYTAYLDSEGEVVFLELLEAGTTASDFAVILGFEPGNISGSFDELDVDDYPQVKLLTADNDIIVYDISVDELDFDGAAEDTGSELGDIMLDTDGADLDSIDIVTMISVGNIVVYDLNSDGEIDDIDLYGDSDDYDKDSADGDDYDEPVLDGGYIVSDDTIIFDISADDVDDWEVINMNSIDMADNADVVYITESDDNDVVVMSTDDNDTTEGDVYAIITKVTTALDGDDTVQKLVGFVDGEADTLYTDDDDDFDANYVDEFLMELTLDGDAVESTTMEAIDVEGLVDTINGDFIKIVGDSYHEIDADVVVYEISFEDDGDVDEVTVADVNDIDEDDYVKFFDTDNDSEGDDDEIDVIIFVSDKDVDESGYNAN